MTENQLIEIFKQPFDKTKWISVLDFVFPENKIFSTSIDLDFDQTYKLKLAERIIQFGEIELSDSSIRLYEVILKENVEIARNRVGVRNLINDYIITGLSDAALVVFRIENDSKWRFSYITKEFDEKTFKDVDSRDRKRYTYVFGQDEKVKTPAQRFIKLANETLKKKEHLNEAFSISGLSDDFFKEYRYQYQNYVQFITGKRVERVKGKWKEVVKSEPNPVLLAFLIIMKN